MATHLISDSQNLNPGSRVVGSNHSIGLSPRINKPFHYTRLRGQANKVLCTSSDSFRVDGKKDKYKGTLSKTCMLTVHIKV